MLISFSLCLVACGGGDDPDEPLTGLVLVEDGKAKFKVVTSSRAGSAAIRAAGDFVTRLRELGVEVDDVISDKSAEDVTDCEIIIGTDVRNRPDGLSISSLELGESGYIIKAVGSRILIAGGTSKLTKSTLDKFIKEHLRIDDAATELKNASVSETLNVYAPTKRPIESLKIAGRDISKFVISCDQSDDAVYPNMVGDFKKMLLEDAGVNLSIIDSDESTDLKRIIFRTTSYAGTDGFRVRVANDNLIIECSYPKVFYDGYDKFISDVFKSGKKDVYFSSSYIYTTNVSTVTYGDFGALGDGKNNDFFAIYNAHVKVNDTKQKINPVGKEGNVFYIGKTWEDGVTNEDGILDCNANGVPHTGKIIPIKTDVNFGDATFIIDDTVPGIHVQTRRQRNIFALVRDNEIVKYSNEFGFGKQISSLTDNPTLFVGATEIPWLKSVLAELSHDEYMVTLVNENHPDFIRYGSNEDDGGARRDVLIVDKNGRISSDTPVIFDFEQITEIQILAVDDSPITVEGGIFKNICALYDPSYGAVNYDSYQRGFLVQRSNSTIKNIDHEMLDEPDDQSYPYYGFVAFNSTYNSTLSDSKLCGHRVYANYKGVSMGSYDLTMNTSINIYFKNITQYRDIKDSKYWGLSASNRTKNMRFDNVKISRIDAHCGLWNLDIKNSEIGFAINVIGGGVVNIENTTKLVGNSFIDLRRDYGATFNGTVNLKDCHLEGYSKWNSLNGEFSGARNTKAYVINANYYSTSKKYREWDFGYTCYMPSNVNLDNFTTSVANLYVFNDVNDAAFDTSLPNGGYQLPKKITYKNMANAPAVCQSSSCTKLLAIIPEAK